MNIIFAIVGAFVAGMASGWFGRRYAWRFCARCGGPIGRVCAQCRHVALQGPGWSAVNGGAA